MSLPLCQGTTSFCLNISNADAIVVWCLDVPFCLLILDEYEDIFLVIFFTLSDFTLYEALFESSSISGKEILSVVVLMRDAVYDHHCLYGVNNLEKVL